MSNDVITDVIVPKQKEIYFIDQDYLNGVDSDDVPTEQLHRNVGYMTGSKLTRELRKTYNVFRSYKFSKRNVDFLFKCADKNDPFDILITHLPFSGGGLGSGKYGTAQENLQNIRKRFDKLPIIGYSGIDLHAFDYYFGKLVNVFIPKTREIDEDVKRIVESVERLLA
jgi:hypothetical protein